MERKIGGHKIFDDQNVGNHMTTDSVFILFKTTDFNTSLVCLGVRCIGDGGGGAKIVAEIGGSQFYRHRLFVNLGPPSEESDSPLIDRPATGNKLFALYH